LPHAGDGFILVGDFQGAFGFLTLGIHGDVAEFGHKGPFAQVYFTTSSIVVSPSKILRKPSSRSVTMPISTAFCRRTMVGARSLMSWRRVSLMARSSKIPFRPL